MRKNTASQVISFHAVSTTDGSDVTSGSPTVYYTIDGGTQSMGSGTTAHEGNGEWSYAPTQAETNGNHVAFTFVLSGAVSQTVNTYPVSFDPTDATRMGMTALPNAAADAAGGLPISDAGGLDLDAILADTNELQGDWVNGGRLDLILDARASQASVDTIDTNVDSVLLDTNALQTDWADGGRLDNILDARASQTSVDTVDSNVDAILLDTGTNGVLISSGTGAGQLNITSGIVDANIEQIETDATASTNLKNQYDGTTGLSGDVFPATQASVANIGTGTAGAINYEAAEDNTGGAIKGASFVGSVDSGALSNTAIEDGVSYVFLDTANDIDVVLGYDVGGSNQGVEVEIVANVDGNADEMKIKAYDFNGAGWDIIGTLDGSGGTAYVRLNLSLLGRHTGAGADIGKVYIRFETDSTTPSQLQIDKCIVGAVTTNRSVGYSNGSVWINTSTGVAGTESFVNGVADNPVSSYANALTIAGNVGLSRYTFTAGDNITLTQSHAADSFFGYNYQLAMANQAPPTYLEGAEITGICNGSATHYVRDSRIGNSSTALTLNQGAVFVNSGLVNVALKDAAAAALDVEFLDCHGNTQGSMFPGGTVDFGTTAGTNHEVSFQRWGGPVTIENLKSGDTVYAHGNGTFILDASCTGGSFRVAGMINLTDNSGGAVSVLEDGRLTKSKIADEIWDTVQADHTTAGSFGEMATELATVLTRMGTPSDLGSGSDLANNLSDMAGATFSNTTDSLEAIRDRGDAAWTTGSGTGLTSLASGTAQGGTASTIQLAAGETFADDILNGTVVNITGGTGAGQSRVIYDYTGSTDTATVTPNWTTNPDATSTYEVVHGSVNITAVSNAAEDLASQTSVDNVDTVVDLIKVDTTAILADTDELQGDWVDGGRLDLILDARASQSSVDTVDGNVDAILVDTADMQPKLGTLSDLGSGATVADNLSDMAGSTFSSTTDSLEAIRDRGDSAWTTGAGGGSGLTALASGTAQSGTASTIQLASSETFGDDILNGTVVNITGGTGAGQSRVIYDYTGSTDTATVTPNWTTSPDATSTYEVVHGSTNVTAVSNAAEDLATATAVDNVDTVVDLIKVDTAAILTDTGTTLPSTLTTIEGKVDTVDSNVDAVLLDTNELQTDWADGGRLDLILDARASQASVDTIDTNVDSILVDTGTTLPATLATIDGNVDSILVDTGTTIPAQITALNDISVSDVLTTAMTESYGTDGSDLTLAQACYLILGNVGEFAISGTSKTVKQLDGTTTAAVYTLDDDTNPTSITRSS